MQDNSPVENEEVPTETVVPSEMPESQVVDDDTAPTEE